MAKVNLMTQTEYAKHRGCSAVAVHKAIKAARISTTIDKETGLEKIDPVVADIQWKSNTRARVQTRPGATPAPTAAPIAPPPAAGTTVSEGDTLPLLAGATDPGDEAAEAPAAAPEQLAGDPAYLEARSSREQASARREWLKLLEEEKHLVRVDQVRAELAAQLAPVREAFLNLPARIASTLAAMEDAARVQNYLEAEIHQALAPLAKAVFDPAADARAIEGQGAATP